MRVGVVALQGDVSEHVSALRGVGAEPVEVRRRDDIEGVDGAVIPGGESTTISSLLFDRGLDAELVEMAESGTPIWGTCAGMILLASEGRGDVERTGQHMLGLLDASVERNAFGRQRESFQAPVEFDGFDEPFEAVFIRAPAYTEVGGGVEVLSEFGGGVVAARDGPILATAFHPELVDDERVHEYFASMVDG
ncbi:MAG: Pyridoxal 5'-phosphate synthase subunit PdxT [Methanonatronarchaeales archaeon]|nr:Pyridoxal 5'-phosphate synthase subunit PdxT [Methanonatronarchaeales archaeon]